MTFATTTKKFKRDEGGGGGKIYRASSTHSQGNLLSDSLTVKSRHNLLTHGKNCQAISQALYKR